MYDYLKCPHKVWRDAHGPKGEFVDEDNPFLKLLWERGVQHETDIIENFGFEFVDCSRGSDAERIEKTNQALAERAEYIYQGVLAHGDLFGIPDLLHFDGSEYIPIEIKSGSAEEGSDETGDGGKPKKHYAVQLALYAEILNRRGLNDSRQAFVIDATGERTKYDLSAAQGPRTPETWYELYERVRSEVSLLLANETSNDPAMCSSCKDCGWYASCKKWAAENDDLTQLFYVGRTVRDTLRRDLETSRIADIIAQDVDMLAAKKKSDKTFLKGIGESSLAKIILRGRLMKNGSEPVMHAAFPFPKAATELFFDIESDPTQDFVYLHGFWVRDSDGGRFVEFTARELSPAAEMKAWAEAIGFIRSFSADEMAIYYYSSYEKSTYRRMRRKFPEVIAEDELEEIFEHTNAIDLYSVVTKMTDWPLGSYGIKAIAQYLKFKWRDETPSGALSIQWFNEYLTTGNNALLNRVLEYNEDDCKATMAVKDYLKQRMEAM
ncbi:MAG: TM0106 family RecB-like putative nuclease [Pyrinomonadaceae bacterium]